MDNIHVFQPNQYDLPLHPNRKNKHKCPYCSKGKWGKYTHFIDLNTGENVGVDVGSCSWETCEKHRPYTPTKFFESRGIYTGSYHKLILNQESGKVKRIVDKCSMISPCKVDLSRSHYDENHFVTYLRNRFDGATVNRLIERFRIGTAQLWSGASVFWQIDREGYVRTGKIGLYDPGDGELLQEQWAHLILKRGSEEWEKDQPYTLHQCLFGEHQLDWEPNDKPVALVESEATAIIASGYKPDYIWMAVGEIDNLSAEMLQYLTGREVVLFPSSDAWNDWTLRMVQIQPMINCHLNISDQLGTIFSEITALTPE